MYQTEVRHNLAQAKKVRDTKCLLGCTSSEQIWTGHLTAVELETSASMVIPLPPPDMKMAREEDGSSLDGRVSWTLGKLAAHPLLEPQVPSQSFESRVRWSFGMLAEIRMLVEPEEPSQSFVSRAKDGSGRWSCYNQRQCVGEGEIWLDQVLNWPDGPNSSDDRPLDSSSGPRPNLWRIGIL